MSNTQGPAHEERGESQKADRSDMWAGVVVGALFLCMFLAAHVRLRGTLIDDAYITYRCARNLAQGNGFVYNVGERVLATTTPGYAVLLAGAGWVLGPGNIPVISRVLSAMFMLVAGCASALAARRVTGSGLAGWVVFGFVLLGPYSLYAGVAGMESSLFLALLALTFLSLLHERLLWSAAAAGLLPLVRPEGVFVVGLLVAVLVIEHLRKGSQAASGRRTLLVALALLLGPGFVWAVASTLYFGSPIPQSIIAKRAGVYPLSHARTIGIVVRGTVRGLSAMDFPKFSRLGAAITWAITAAILTVGGVWLCRQGRRLWMVPAIVVIMLVFYATSHTSIFPHYRTLFEPLTKLCWWAGLLAVANRELKARGAGERWKRSAAAGAALVALFPAFFYFPWVGVWRGEVHVNQLFYRNQLWRMPEYRKIAGRIAPHLPDGASVLMPEIGELGYFMPKVKVLDCCALVSPEALPYLAVPDEQRVHVFITPIPNDLVRDLRPDLLMTVEVFGRESILKDAWFLEHYAPVYIDVGLWLPWTSKAFYVFSRRDFEPGMKLKAILGGSAGQGM